METAVKANQKDALPRFDNAQAWYGPRMSPRTDWIYQLSAREVAEIDHAVATAEAAGVDLLHLRREHFPLDTFAERLRAIRHDVLHGRGFVLIRGIPVQRYSLQQSAIAYLGMGHYLGEPVSQNAKGHILGHVKSLGLDYSRPDVRLYQTEHPIEFHSDYSDVVGLLCLHTARSGGASSIASSTTVWNEMIERRPELARILMGPLYYTRSGEIPAGKQRYSEVPVFTPWQGRMITFYSSRATSKKAQAFPEVPRVTPEQNEAMDLVEALASDPAIRLDMDFKPGDVQLLLNHAVLHARTNYVDWPEPERRRHLLRLWLACDDGPGLPPFFTTTFQGRTSTGRPDGIRVPGGELKVPLEAE